MADMTDRIRNRIAQDFPAPGSADEVTRLVSGATCCGWGSSPERVQASILLWARGDVGRVRVAVATAKSDYRDAVTLGGLAHEGWEQKLDTELGPERIMTDTRLLHAAQRALGETLHGYGFSIRSSVDSHRGSTIECFNHYLTISVYADWLEGELNITVQTPGSRAAPLESLVDLSQVKGLSLSRLRRGVSSGGLESRLRKVGEALRTQVPTLLEGSNEALLRLIRAAPIKER